MPPSGATLPASVIYKLQALAERKLGLEARPGKEVLLSVRASRHMRELGATSAEDYLRLLEEDPSGKRMQGLLDVLTTNHTAFWREASHFEWLRRQLLALPAGAPQVTLWCAAASSGEEPYTLAMIALESLGPGAAQRLRVLATDVSTRMLRAAGQGIYSRERIQPLPESWKERFFEPDYATGEGNFRVSREVRSMVHFRWLNLMDPLPRIGPFPIIFCRNVMIYFSQDKRLEIVGKLMNLLVPGGYLLVGHAEGLSGLESEMDYVEPAIYRRRAAGPAAAAGRGELNWAQ